jgi:hypothetical protein
MIGKNSENDELIKQLSYYRPFEDKCAKYEH